MSIVRFAATAREDLIDIWLYVVEDSPQAADDLLDRIHHTCQLLADSPGIGRERPELRRACRSFAVGR